MMLTVSGGRCNGGSLLDTCVSFDEVVEHLTDYMIEDVKQTNDSRPTRFLEDRGFYEMHDDNGKANSQALGFDLQCYPWYNRDITTKKGSE